MVDKAGVSVKTVQAISIMVISGGVFLQRMVTSKATFTQRTAISRVLYMHQAVHSLMVVSLIVPLII